MESTEGTDRLTDSPEQESQGSVEGGGEDLLSASSGIELDVIRLGFPGYQVLRKKNIDIEEITPHVELLAKSMIKTMYSEPGVGLAAPQIGANVNLLVMDPSYDLEDESSRKPVIMVNPKLTMIGEEVEEALEACLSVPNITARVVRSTKVTVEFLDISGTPQTFILEGMPARIVQHEVDHLNGKLIIDYLSKLKRDLYMRKMFKTMRKAKKVQRRAKKYADLVRASEGRVERARRRNVHNSDEEKVDEPGPRSDGDGSGVPDSSTS
jgi:peptide deformylase